MSREKSGSVEAFSANWINGPENDRYHFWRGAPQNQIQFAFQNHWRVFRHVIGDIQTGRMLEVGCGRGSMAAFFADSGFETHLLDTSHPVLKIARANFGADGLKGNYICGDALYLSYPSGTFDVVASIGLFEHFLDIEKPLREQIRILKPGGIFLGYIVPERPISIQTLAIPINTVLWLGYKIKRAIKPAGAATKQPSKTPLYRNKYTSKDYLAILSKSEVETLGSYGLFPVPLISHSPKFPFSLMDPALERPLVKLWQFLLRPGPDHRRDPWACPEGWGLAFLVWAKKGKE